MIAKWVAFKQNPLRFLRQPIGAWLVGICGLFGYHALYFTAVQNAPVAEANLINYTWPLLIVLFSGLLPGERLRWFHVLGAVLGLGGAVLIVTKGESLSVDPAYAFGYGIAITASLFWSSYSVLSRRFAHVPTDAVGAFCLVTAILSFLVHGLTEETIWPETWHNWLAVLALGVGPVGLAFLTWDVGMKRGNIQLLGVFAYGAPLFSTILLVLLGISEGTTLVTFAALLITGGAVVASKDIILERRKP